MPDLPEDEDARLALLFRAAAAPVADDGFSDRVMGRIRRRAWQRRLVLAGAGAAGLAIAWRPACDLAGTLGRQLAVRGDQLALLGGELSLRWPELTASLLQGPNALYFAALALVVPLLRLLED
jgi:hypothetical protein